MTRLFDSILCPVDFDEKSLIAAKTARDMLQGPDGRLYLLHVMNFKFPLTDEEAATPLSEMKQKIEEIARKHFGNKIHYEVLVEKSDDTARSILEAARRIPVGCIVMATHARKGIDRFLLGSIAESVERESFCPVIIMRAEPQLMTVQPTESEPSPTKIEAAHTKIVVLDGHALNPGDLSWKALGAIGELQVFDRTADDQIVARAHQAEIVLTNKTRLPAQILRQLIKTRYIGVLATGYDVVDLQAARELKISVTNVPTYAAASVAEFTFALLLELCHHVALHGQATRAGEWWRSMDFSFWKTPLVELAGKTIGLIGLGQIGRRVAEIALAFEMRVIAADAVRSPVPAWPRFRWCEVDELLPQADVVSLHCPLLPQTQGIINAKSLATMKPSAFLVNTSRGPLVIEQDLADALNNGRLAGAAVDVLSSEPPSSDNPLLRAKNCIVTPHIAWATKEARTRLLDTAIANVRAFLHGHPVNVVN